MKPEQFETSDVKQAVSFHYSSQDITGRSQGHSALNIGKLASIDSASKWASGSLEADVKDVPSNLLSNVSVACEEASNIGEPLQNLSINLNDDTSFQDQQEMPIEQ